MDFGNKKQTKQTKKQCSKGKDTIRYKNVWEIKRYTCKRHFTMSGLNGTVKIIFLSLKFERLNGVEPVQSLSDINRDF